MVTTLKNELEILTADDGWLHKAGPDAVYDRLDFSENFAASCGHVRDAWMAAAFSVKNDMTVRRYFDFHFKLLCGLISQCGPDGYPLGQLNSLMDHLLLYYGHFLDQRQPVAPAYFSYKIQQLRPAYESWKRLPGWSSVSTSLRDCLEVCLSPLYTGVADGQGTLGDLFYRERLICGLGATAADTAALTDEQLISSLMALNFNHFLFFKYMQERVNAALGVITPALRGKYLLDQSVRIPLSTTADGLVFDRRWPGIAELYKNWLYEQGRLLSLGAFPGEPGTDCPRIPLNMSVAYLACMIRGLHESGVYGNVSLSAIFEHAANVFTTKRQQNISADSLSNAYYNISQPTAARMIGIFESASGSLRLRYFPA